MFLHEDAYLATEYKIAKKLKKKINVVWLEDFESFEEVNVNMRPWYVKMKDLHYLDVKGESARVIVGKIIREFRLLHRIEPQPEPISDMPSHLKSSSGKGEKEEAGKPVPRGLREGNRGIKFGRYPQGEHNEVMPLTWRVLKVQDGKALLITEKLIACRKYHKEYEEITWSKCSLREWLNGKFIRKAFYDWEEARIAKVRNRNPDNDEFGTDGGVDTDDRVFVLSLDEVLDVSNFRDNDDRQTVLTPYAIKRMEKGLEEDKKTSNLNPYRTIDDITKKLPSGERTGWWWLRSPGFHSHHAAYVHYDGDVDEDGYFVDYSSVSVRPALWLNL